MYIVIQGQKQSTQFYIEIISILKEVHACIYYCHINFIYVHLYNASIQ